jgi:hypothetical protein
MGLQQAGGIAVHGLTSAWLVNITQIVFAQEPAATGLHMDHSAVVV